jgi:hypothetical protein
MKKNTSLFLVCFSCWWLLTIKICFAEYSPNKVNQQEEQYFQQNELVDTLDYPREAYQQTEQYLQQGNPLKALAEIDKFIANDIYSGTYSDPSLNFVTFCCAITSHQQLTSLIS